MATLTRIGDRPARFADGRRVAPSPPEERCHSAHLTAHTMDTWDVMEMTNQMVGNQDRWLVALFGESLFMDMVEAGLRESSEFGVVRIDSSLDDAGVHLQSLHPDLVVLDLNTPQFQSAVVLLRDQPGIPVLCLDANCNQVMTLSSQQHTPATVEDLGGLVRAAVGRVSGGARHGRLPGEPLHRAGSSPVA